jgi:protein required for attachment to host cells
MQITPTWILIANATEAFVYKATQHHHNEINKHAESFDPIKSLSHPDSRLKVSELVTEKSGKHDSTGANGQYESHHDAHDTEAERFAKEIAEVLEKGREANEYERLLICAPDRFLGLLNARLSKHVDRMVSERVHHDYAALNKNERNEKLSEIFKKLV